MLRSEFVDYWNGRSSGEMKAVIASLISAIVVAGVTLSFLYNQPGLILRFLPLGILTIILLLFRLYLRLFCGKAEDSFVRCPHCSCHVVGAQAPTTIATGKCHKCGNTILTTSIEFDDLENIQGVNRLTKDEFSNAAKSFGKWVKLIQLPTYGFFILSLLGYCALRINTGSAHEHCMVLAFMFSCLSYGLKWERVRMKAFYLNCPYCIKIYRNTALVLATDRCPSCEKVVLSQS